MDDGDDKYLAINAIIATVIICAICYFAFMRG